MSINLTVEVDNETAIRKFRELQNTAKSATSNIVSDADRMDVAMRKFGTALSALGIGLSIRELANFAQKIASVRGEFQQLEVAFTTMLGSKAEADDLMARTVEFAAKTPFDLQGVASGTKQLLAFGSSASEVTDEMRMLGDIAAGLSIPIGDLVYLYGTTRTQGRMFTQDLRQFMGRGIPLADELAKQFGVTKDKVGELVTEGKVGFEEMRKALVSMTSEGGKFYNLMAEQSKTITGQISNLEDSFQQMYNEIGKKSEGAISKAIEGASYLVENYEKVGRVIMDIIAVYGSYKAAVIALNVVKRVSAAYDAAGIVAARAAAIANKQVTASIVLQTKALKALNVVKYLKNPYVLAGAAIAGVVFGAYKLITAKSAEARAQERVNELMDEYNQKASEEKQKALDNARAMQDANLSAMERVRSFNSLIEKYPELLSKYDEEKIKLMDIAELTREINSIEEKKSMNFLVSRKNTLEAQLEAINMESWDPLTETYSYNASNAGIVATLKAELAVVNKEIAKMKRLQEQAAFEALSLDEKIQKYKEDISSLDAEIGKLNSEIDRDAAIGLSSSDKILSRDTLLSQKGEAEKRLGTLEDEKEKRNKGSNDKDEDAQKEITKARQKAQDDAYKAELEARKAYIKDKAVLLSLERDEELKAIQDRINATTDKETKAALERQKIATEKIYNKRIDDALGEEVSSHEQEENERIEKEREYFNALLGEIATYNQKRQAILKEYKEKEDALYRKDDSGNKVLKEGVTNENLKILESQRDKDIEALSDEFFADSEKFNSWLEQFADATVVTLENEREKLEKIAKTISDPEQKAYIDYLLKTIDGLSKENKKDSKEVTSQEKWTTILSAINDVGSAAQDALDNIEGMDSGLKNMLSDTLNLANGVGNLVIAIKGIKGATRGLEKASAILAVISAAIQAVSALFSVFNGGESSMDRTLRQFRDLNSELDELYKRAKLDNWEDSIFGQDGFGKASTAVSVYNDALDRYNKTIGTIIAKSKFADTQFAWLAGFAGDQFSGGASNIEDAVKNMMAQTRHETWFRSAKYSSLGDLIPELVGDDGKLYMEALQKFMENDLFKTLSDQNQQLIKDMVSDWELYEDALDEMRGYLSDVFGGLGDEITDALVTAFENGTDASIAFTDSLSNMLETFAKDMVKALMFSQIFKSAEEDMLAVMKDSNLSDDLKFIKYAQIFKDMTQQATAQQDDAMALIEKLQEIANGAGFNIFAADESAKNAQGSGFQTMSQETGSELNGRFTDIQGKVTEIRTFIIEIMAMGKLQYNESINIRDIIIQLNGNVGDIRSYTKVLPEMKDAITSMNKKLDNL